MPWKETDTMNERCRFLLEWERRMEETSGGHINLAELCRLFGVSRQTGYLWINRYRTSGYDCPFADATPGHIEPASSVGAVIGSARRFIPEMVPFRRRKGPMRLSLPSA